MLSLFNATRRLQKVKDSLGQIEFLDLRQLDLVAAHRVLGENVAGQAHKVIEHEIGGLKPVEWERKIRLVRYYRKALDSRLHKKSIPEMVRVALAEYNACLESWGQGAGVMNYSLPAHLAVVDGAPVTAGEIAVFLQDENPGCQTGLYRDRDGAAILWHTEEDVEKHPGDHFDKLRIAIFQIREGDRAVDLYTFVYPGLMPGVAFSWRADGFIQAVDSLFIKPVIQEDALFASMACWVLLRLGKTIEPRLVIESLRPFVDGYAVNYAWFAGNDVLAGNVEFAGDQVMTRELASQPGASLCQVNVFSDRNSPIAQKFERVKPASRRRFEKRLERTNKALEEVRMSARPREALLALLASRNSGEWGYANSDVKATFLAQVVKSGLHVWTAPGPVIDPAIRQGTFEWHTT